MYVQVIFDSFTFDSKTKSLQKVLMASDEVKIWSIKTNKKLKQQFFSALCNRKGNSNVIQVYIS